MICHNIHMLYASTALDIVFVFGCGNARVCVRVRATVCLCVPQFVLNVCLCSGNDVRCQPCLKVHKSFLLQGSAQ